MSEQACKSQLKILVSIPTSMIPVGINVISMVAVGFPVMKVLQKSSFTRICCTSEPTAPASEDKNIVTDIVPLEEEEQSSEFKKFVLSFNKKYECKCSCIFYFPFLTTKLLVNPIYLIIYNLIIESIVLQISRSSTI